MNYGSLAATGATLTIGGIVLGQVWLVAISAGLIIAGALVVRVSFRRRKTASQI